jgi:hypothetical protein
MKKLTFSFLFFIVILCLFSAPVFVSAVTQISLNIPGGPNAYPTSTGPGGFVANFYQFALMIGGVLAFGVIVYGGVRYMASAGNPSGQSDAKEWIESALLGLLLLVGAYFILDVINPQLLNLKLPTLTQINIQVPATPVGGTSGSSGSGTGAGTGTGTGTGAGGSAEANSIAAAAAAAQQSKMSSANAPGTDGGRKACAWAVNQVLTSDGVAPLDTNSVQSMENALTSGRGTLVDPSQAMPGDIVIQAQDGHVGICMNVGCTQVISNSSSNASFTWVSNTSFSQSYSGGPGRIYQLNS